MKNLPGKLQILFLALFIIFAFQCGFFYVSCVDIGFHLRTGELLLNQQRIPEINTFSFTEPDQPWFLHQWFPAAIYYVIFKAGGLTGLIAFKALLGVIIFLVIWLSSRNETGSRSFWPFWAASLSIMIARIRFFERPYMFSCIFLALLFYCLRKYKNNRLWEWLFLPAMMALWANTHIGVIYGFVLLGVFTLSNCCCSKKIASSDNFHATFTVNQRQFGIGIFLSAIAVIISLWLINPNGINVLKAPFAYFFNPFWRNYIAELKPPSGIYAKLIYGYIVILVLLQIRARKKFNPPLFLSSLVFAYLACRSQRSILVFMIIATPYMSSLLESVFPLRTNLARKIYSGALVPVWALLFCLVILPNKTYRYGIGLSNYYYPSEIYSFIKKEVARQNIYNDLEFGGSLLWFLYPDFRPFIDGRGEAYSLKFWQDTYVPVSQGKPIWSEIFSKYEICGALIYNETSKPIHNLATQLYKHPDWALVAFNDNTLLFLKRTKENRVVISQYEYHLIWPGDWTLSKITDKNLDRAFAEARRAGKIAVNSRYARTALARSFMLSGDYSAAADLYAEFIKKGGAAGNYQRDYGYCLYRDGKYSEAEKIFSYMIDNNIYTGFSYYMKHYIALGKNDIIKADKLLNKALEISPDEESYLKARSELNEFLIKKDQR